MFEIVEHNNGLLFVLETRLFVLSSQFEKKHRFPLLLYNITKKTLYLMFLIKKYFESEQSVS